MLPRIMTTKGIIGVTVFILLCLTYTSVGVATENGKMKKELQERLQQSVQSDVYVQSDDFDPWDPCSSLASELISLAPGKTYRIIPNEQTNRDTFIYFCNDEDNLTSVDMAEYFHSSREFAYRDAYPSDYAIYGFKEVVYKVNGPHPMIIGLDYILGYSIEETDEESLVEVIIGPGESYIFKNLNRPSFEPFDSISEITIEGEPGVRFDLITYDGYGNQVGVVHHSNDDWFFHLDHGMPIYSYLPFGGSFVITNVSSTPISTYGPRKSNIIEKGNLPALIDGEIFPEKLGVLKNTSDYEAFALVVLERGQRYDYKIYNIDGSIHQEAEDISLSWTKVPSGGKLVVFNTRSNKPIKIVGDYPGYHEQSYRTLDFYVQKGFNNPVKIEDFEAIQFLAGPYEHNMYINLPVNAEEDMVENVDYIIFNDSIWYSVDQLRANGVNFTIEDEYVQMNVTDGGLIGRIDNPGSIITTYSTCAPSCDYSIFLFSGVNTESPMWDEAIPVIRNQFSTGNKQVAIHQYHPFGLADGLEGRKRLQFIGLQLLEAQNLRHSEQSRSIDVNFIKQNISGGKVVLVGHSAGGVAAYRAAVTLESEEEILIGNVVAVGSPKWYLPLSDINDQFIYIESLYDRLTGGEWGVVRAPAHSLIIELNPESRDTFFGDHAYYFSNLEWTDSEGDARNNVRDTVELIYEYTH